MEPSRQSHGGRDGGKRWRIHGEERSGEGARVGDRLGDWSTQVVIARRVPYSFKLQRLWDGQETTIDGAGGGGGGASARPAPMTWREDGAWMRLRSRGSRGYRRA